ncbi:MAG: ATP-binding cassette domain-containing protein [Chloroflexota bacterium]
MEYDMRVVREISDHVVVLDHGERIADGGLDVRYGAVRALRGVDLEVRAGEIVTLLGANGAGKSTLLRAVSGLQRPAAGSIALDGRPVTELPAHARVRLGVGHVPEGRRVFARLTVAENLAMGGWTRTPAENAERAAETDALFPRLAERRAQPAGTLSGGEQQMLAIGRALMGRPRLLLLDEPSLGLAPVLVALIFRVIREIRAAGTTILLVEQNAAQALAVADRGYVLRAGEIVLGGSAAELRADPAVRQAYLGEDA